MIKKQVSWNSPKEELPYALYVYVIPKEDSTTIKFARCQHYDTNILIGNNNNLTQEEKNKDFPVIWEIFDSFESQPVKIDAPLYWCHVGDLNPSLKASTFNEEGMNKAKISMYDYTIHNADKFKKEGSLVIGEK